MLPGQNVENELQGDRAPTEGTNNRPKEQTQKNARKNYSCEVLILVCFFLLLKTERQLGEILDINGAYNLP